MKSDIETRESFMREALVEAKKALESGDVPIGAVVVRGGEIIGRGFNRVERDGDPLAHAELIAIADAVRNSDYKRLLGTEIFATLEPCAMCAGAIVLARIERVIFGAADPKAGACGSVLSIAQNDRLNHRCEVVSGVLQAECSQMLKDFFANLRKRRG